MLDSILSLFASIFYSFQLLCFMTETGEGTTFFFKIVQKMPTIKKRLIN